MTVFLECSTAKVELPKGQSFARTRGCAVGLKRPPAVKTGGRCGLLEIAVYFLLGAGLVGMTGLADLGGLGLAPGVPPGELVSEP